MKYVLFFCLPIFCFSVSAQEISTEPKPPKPVKTLAAAFFNYSPIFKNQGMYTFKDYEDGFFETTGAAAATTVRFGLSLRQFQIQESSGASPAMVRKKAGPIFVQMPAHSRPAYLAANPITRI
jgi:hypothetical protein